MNTILISTLVTLAGRWQAEADAAPGYQRTALRNNVLKEQP